MTTHLPEDRWVAQVTHVRFGYTIKFSNGLLTQEPLSHCWTRRGAERHARRTLARLNRPPETWQVPP